jgi:hypothetical protein
MIAPEKPTAEPSEDDDLDLDLSESETPLGEDESVGPEDDGEPGGMAGADEEDREIGLDAETGLEDGLDGAEEVSAADDAGSWLDDEVGTGSDDDDDDGDEEEATLGEDGEPPAEQGGEFDDDLTFEEVDSVAGDSGDEGFGDESVLSGLDLEGLPKLDGSGDGEEGLESESNLESGPELRVSRPVPAEETRSPRAALELLQRSGRPLSALIAAGETGWAWDGSLLVAEPDALKAERRFAGAETAYALAAAGTDSLIALATPGGLLCSRDAGRSFAPAVGVGSGAWAPSALAFTDVGAGPVLWAAPPAGALHRSGDGGRSFETVAVLPRVLRLASDGRSQLIVLGRDAKGGACAARSEDGGETFAALALPFSDVERVQDVQVCGAALLFSRRGLSPQLVWCGDDGEFSPLFRDAAPPVVLLEEGGLTRAYCCRSVRGGHALVRVELATASADPAPARGVAARAGGTRPELVLELPADAGTPLQLSGAQRGAATTLQLGCERAWYRIRVWAEDLLV